MQLSKNTLNVKHKWSPIAPMRSPLSWALQAVMWFHVLSVWWPEDNVPSTHDSSPLRLNPSGRTDLGGSLSITGSEGRDNIMCLREQIVQLQVVIWRPQRTRGSNPQPSGNVRNGNRNQNNVRGESNNRNNCERCDHNEIKCFQCESWGHRAQRCPRIPWNGNWGRLGVPPTCPLRYKNRCRGTRDVGKCKHTGSRTQVS